MAESPSPPRGSRAFPGTESSEAKHPRLQNKPRVFSSGDVLLSHDLSSYYHRGCSVSLPCSEWERVVPLRWGHQKFVPRWRDKFLAAALSHRVQHRPQLVSEAQLDAGALNLWA